MVEEKKERKALLRAPGSIFIGILPSGFFPGRKKRVEREQDRSRRKAPGNEALESVCSPLFKAGLRTQAFQKAETDTPVLKSSHI